MNDPRSHYAPLHDPAYERDACGVGLVVDIAGRPSRDIVDRALAGIVNLTHRGGVGADARTGDGAGILTQIPFDLFAPDLAAAGRSGMERSELGVAMLFHPTDPAKGSACKTGFAAAVAAEGLDVIGWRDVPIDPSVLGDVARSTLPGIAQLLIARPA
ncbi:MAG: glutamate synthase subunit alpha, partial [Thermomicrobiales bacterium]